MWTRNVAVGWEKVIMEWGKVILGWTGNGHFGTRLSQLGSNSYQKGTYGGLGPEVIKV